MSNPTVSIQTQKNWWIDAALICSAIVASLSGIYFLLFPSGGFQGGRNAMFNVQVLFSRHTWDDLHTWSGLIMIIIALTHLVIHFSWVENMARRIWNELRGKCGCMQARGRWNLILNTIVAISFGLTSVSGVYFYFFPHGRSTIDPMFVFSRVIWDQIHTWAGVIFISAAVIHFAIHWKWVAKVTHKMVGMVQLTRRSNSPYLS